MGIKVNKLPQKFGLEQPFIHDRTIWLAGTGICLALLHLVLTWQLMHQSDQIVINALFWLAILKMVVKRGDQISSDRFSRFAGLLMLGLIVAISLSSFQVEAWFVRLFPALAVLSLCLLVSGFRLKHQRRTGLLLIPLMIPRGIVEQAIEKAIGQPIQILTAQFSAFALHYVGFNAVQQNTTITLKQGAVDVLFRCTGIPLLILLLQLALFFFVMFPLTQQQRIKVLIVAGLISFLLSGFRVALMAVVVQDQLLFNFWHGGSGSQIFSTSAIVLFGWFCQQSLESQTA